MEYLYICEVCGSPEVQVQEWRSANSNEWCGEGTADPFCPQCGDETCIEVLDVDSHLDAYARAITWSECYHGCNA